LNGIIKYVNGSIEADGSYGEGVGYFDYPIGALFPALLAMDQGERTALLAGSGLRSSASWMVYPYLFSSNEHDKYTLLHSGDNSYRGKPGSKVCIILKYLLNDPAAAWLHDWSAPVPDMRE